MCVGYRIGVGTFSYIVLGSGVHGGDAVVDAVALDARVERLVGLGDGRVFQVGGGGDVGGPAGGQGARWCVWRVEGGRGGRGVNGMCVRGGKG